MHNSVWIGFDPREVEGFGVCRHSIRQYDKSIPIHALVLEDLIDAGLYWRPLSRRDGRLWDNISEAPMATEFAVSRFLTPILAAEQWALFLDCDIVALGDIRELFALADPKYAVMCVKHQHAPPPGIKMDGQLQTMYKRKNWSSVCLYNTQHKSNDKLTVDLVNELPGRALHAFSWLEDHEIGELPPEYNYLVGHTVLPAGKTPKLVHFTEGMPNMEGYSNVEYANDWRALRRSWLSSLKGGRYASEGAKTYGPEGARAS